MKTTKAAAAILLVLMFAACRKENLVSSVAVQSNLLSEDVLNQTQVKIGAQVWMKKDLSISTYRNGDRIPQVKDPAKWAALTTGAWC